jgi:holo-[acyl-carrier protein] synthase
MVRGIGVDVTQVDRIDKAYRRFGGRFVDRLLGAQEKHELKKRRDPLMFLAGRFAAKEALIKALATLLTWRPAWAELQVLAGSGGRPVIVVDCDRLGLPADLRFHVSIGHERMYAVAVVIVEGADQSSQDLRQSAK